ncbi:MAG: MazG family protein [Dehalococcoidia bacterium]|nr:MazG family protein [Dehalococcoidia bacterium]
MVEPDRPESHPAPTSDSGPDFGPDSDPSLDEVAHALGLAAHQVHAFDPAFPDFDAQRPLLVLAPQFEAARPLVRRRYPPAAVASVLTSVLTGGEGGRGRAVEEARVAALPFDAAAWLLPALLPHEDLRSLKGLRLTMERLFGPDGCPWDREQTHETLRPFLLEETYELVDAIDQGDMDGLLEEVGDVLAHMFMQGAVAQQDGSFELEDAVAYATAKFVRRHPHVFGDAETDTPEALLGKWEEIKAQERAARSEAGEDAASEGALDSVPAAAPSLSRAQALFRRAGRAGLRPPAEAPLDALRDAVADEAWPLALAALARLLQAADIDAEETLRQASQRFTLAFRALEREARAAGAGHEADLAALPADRHEEVWRSLEG